MEEKNEEEEYGRYEILLGNVKNGWIVNLMYKSTVYNNFIWTSSMGDDSELCINLDL